MHYVGMLLSALIVSVFALIILGVSLTMAYVVIAIVAAII